ncbi:RXT2 domain-containing protein [Aspergillus fischeri NRRL 181]|uniref:Transcriptional regulatory protein RXT2 N-terminal domain-containing protein n=1 Tax=Neosartorya fischeri (strain ATCC 1020 / DSM 3700 / CBS 544.65 / FGSC A1164 / JCM 1740 / NRRL 181 / WB 181) TaxID=331117 RepID=A1D3G9_NEOFI|nr:conserved hypothetical protein [Aspergillus fischeri NRRL 181]EAW22962.1 conserved hypothetical protein [Aspergillus fischeri NRRL 181]
MAAQAALIADTIIGMKRALRRETEYSGPDEPITQPTNRGNKLRANAKYVREGALGYIHPEQLYKQKIEHAGYTRYILQRNPVRYDSEGDELDEDDEDSEADAAAAEENPFSEIALENLLCPLKHPSELPTHPSLSHAYTSKALRNMTQAVEAKLRQERALLWRARNLHRQFLGDGSWMPCGMFETAEDRFLFEPWTSYAMRGSPSGEHALNGLVDSVAPDKSNQESPAAQAGGKDVEMMDAQNNEAEVQTDENTIKNDRSMQPKSEEVDAAVTDLPPHRDTANSESQINGHIATGGKQDHDSVANLDQHPIEEKGKARANDEQGAEAEAEQQDDPQGDETDTEMQDGSSPEPPRRMTTRAQANASNPEPDQVSSKLSPSASTDTLNALPAPHPLFLVPESVLPDPNFGLPANEAEETRRLLWSFIQKQEETVRGFEHMLECLFRACRMQEDVFEWCKAEGHVGELSDGEDWYDPEKWGLAEGEELKKGVDEDEIETVEESRATGKRGRGRRA